MKYQLNMSLQSNLTNQMLSRYHWLQRSNRLTMSFNFDFNNIKKNVLTYKQNIFCRKISNLTFIKWHEKQKCHLLLSRIHCTKFGNYHYQASGQHVRWRPQPEIDLWPNNQDIIYLSIQYLLKVKLLPSKGVIRYWMTKTSHM